VTIAVTKCALPIGYLPTFVPAKVELDKVRLVVEGNCVLQRGLGYDCHKLIKTSTSPKLYIKHRDYHLTDEIKTFNANEGVALLSL
jgi:hypothetical protein